MTWYQFAIAAAQYAEMNTDLIIPTTSIATIAKRPRFSALASEKYTLMPDVQQGLQEYFLHRATTINY
jgi:dTDP-4-dehydrorhamnose reductase